MSSYIHGERNEYMDILMGTDSKAIPTHHEDGEQKEVVFICPVCGADEFEDLSLTYGEASGLSALVRCPNCHAGAPDRAIAHIWKVTFQDGQIRAHWRLDQEIAG